MAEHAVLVQLTLSGGEFGSEAETDAIHELTDKLEEAIEERDAGEFDGDEFGGGKCTLFMYGSDADALFAAVEPLLRASPLTRGGLAIKRYGAAGDADAKEARIDF